MFRPNQNIICIKNHSNKLVLKGEIFEINSIRELCQCRGIGISLKNFSKGTSKSLCGICGAIFEGRWFSSHLFRPLLYQDATAYILKNFAQIQEKIDIEILEEQEL